MTPALLHEHKPEELFTECREVVMHGKERDRYKKEIRQYFSEDILTIDCQISIECMEYGRQ
jgi:hypothetical protein